MRTELHPERQLGTSDEAGLIWALFRLAFLLAFLIVWSLRAGVGAPLTGPASSVIIAAGVYCLIVMLLYARFGRLPFLRPVTVLIDLFFVTACLGVPEAAVC
jgi:hypothetical protein